MRPTPWAWAGRLILAATEAHIRRLSAMRARIFAAALLACLLAPGLARASLQPQLERALRVPHVSLAATGAVAVDLATGQTLYSRNESLPLLPASNEKLAVTYAAL